MAKILVTWLASEVKLGCLSYPYYFEMRDVCEDRRRSRVSTRYVP